MTLGEKILDLRKKKGVSQETMAFDLFVSRQAVSKWETDQSIPDLDKIKLISEYFSVSIDYLVSDIECSNETNIEKEKLLDLNKSNATKRIVKIMLKTCIAFNLLYFVSSFFCVVFQQLILLIYKNMYETVYVFPWIELIKYLIINVFIIVMSFYLLKQLKSYSKKINDKIIIITLYVIGSLFVGIILGVVQKHILENMPVEKVQVYFELTNLLSQYNIIAEIGIMMFIISNAMLIVIATNDGSRYVLPSVKKEYKAKDSVLSFCVGLFLGVPGLLFEIIWLLDAKTDNVYRFKKKRFWYLIGIIIPIIISIFNILIILF